MRIIVAVSRWLRAVSAVVLTFLFCVTVLDVVMRIFWKPLSGVYELVSMSGAIIIVFALPLSMLDNAHVTWISSLIVYESVRSAYWRSLQGSW